MYYGGNGKVVGDKIILYNNVCLISKASEKIACKKILKIAVFDNSSYDVRLQRTTANICINLTLPETSHCTTPCC